MSKLKWFIIGAMMVTVMAVLVGCGAKNDSESGSNSGSGNNNKSTVENLMTEAATGAKEMMTEAATGAKEMMSTAENGMKGNCNRDFISIPRIINTVSKSPADV